jgi:hypothetical protein
LELTIERIAVAGLVGNGGSQQYQNRRERVMKFLILMKHRKGATPSEDPVAASKAARAALKASVADGRMDCVYQFADGRRAVAIMNAESAEAVWERLTAYPLYSLQDYEVHPLVDVDFVFERTLERMKEAAGE